MTTIFERNWTTRTGTPKRAYRVTFTASGKKKFRQFTRRKDAQAFLERLSVERPRLEAAAKSSPTVRALAQAWIDACVAGREGRAPLEEYTVENYRSYVKNHIEPRFGAVQVHLVTKHHFRRLREELHAQGLSRITVKKILGAFKSIVQHGVDCDHIDTHPGNGITVRDAARGAKLVEIPSPEEVSGFLDAARGFLLDRDKRVAHAWETYIVFLQLLIGTGVRLSEARGLRVRDVRHDCILIRQRADRGGNIGPPKSRSGIRTIFAAHVLAEALLRRCEGRKGHELVFASRTGRPLDTQNLGKRFWKPLCETTGTTGYGMHSLRHHYASRLIAAGLSIREVSAALGHADPSVTLRTYAHLFQDVDSIRKRKQVAETLLSDYMSLPISPDTQV